MEGSRGLTLDQAKLEFEKAGADGRDVILFVDDEPEILNLYREMFSEWKFEVQTVADPREALSLIKKAMPRLLMIISDYEMPGMSGLQLREAMLPEASSIPFIILSAYVDRATAISGIENKVSAFVDKPINPGRLAAVLIREGLPRLNSLKEERELLAGFLGEAKEMVGRIEELLVDIETRPGDTDTLNVLFGMVHTLKGSSSFFEPKTLHRYVHGFEDVLKQAQRGEIKLSSAAISSLLGGLDRIRLLLAEFETGEHTDLDVDAELKTLKAFETVAGESDVVEKPAESSLNQGGPGRSRSRDAEIRVAVASLDEFLQMSGEMTVVRNMLNKCVRSIERQYTGDKDIATLVDLLDILHKVNGAVQTKVSDLRKVSVRSVTKSLPRGVRDVARALGKEVELHIGGEDLRVDMAIAEVMSASLLHLVKNCVDHGLEDPETRKRVGKNPVGRVAVVTSIADDHVFVEVTDDGKGIDTRAIREKLAASGALSRDEAEALSEEAARMMIFSPGLSTANAVTDISGRGVGMSAVKSEVEAIGGLIHVDSSPGEGSRFLLKMPIPKSVLIVSCLFVKSGRAQFGVPKDCIARVLQISSRDSTERLRLLQGRPVLLNDGELLPVADMAELLDEDSPKRGEAGDRFFLVLQSPTSEVRCALEIDEILEVEDTVVKSLPRFVDPSRLFGGATFLDDGTIGLLLSVDGILARVGVDEAPVKGSGSPKAVAPPPTRGVQSLRPSVVIEIGCGDLFAIPQSDVLRIEEISLGGATNVAGRSIVPYRGQALNLVDLQRFLVPSQRQTPYSTGTHQVVVVRLGTELLGLIVKDVLDVTEIEPFPEPGGPPADWQRADFRGRTVTVLETGEIINGRR